MRKKKFKPVQIERLADFLINIASAWFIGGIVSPFFTKPPVTWSLFSDVIIAIINSGILLFIALNIK